MSNKLFKVTYTEPANASTHTTASGWRFEVVDKVSPLVGSGVFNGNRQYFAHGIVARDERDAAAHATELWADASEAKAVLMVIGAPTNLHA